jgi:tRNA pseudouridine55 synthase
MNDNSGILLINKTKGKSSFTLVNLLRKITKIKKIGHAGTLDPFATGLMIMLIGKEYTKKSLIFMNYEKEYLCKIHLGYTTKSFDPEEKLEFVSKKVPTNEELNQLLNQFQGKLKQIPPMYSAKKINGQRLYLLARKNIIIEREPIEISLTTQLISYNYPYIELKIICSKGTYIRSIANDLGQKLDCGAYLKELTRTRCGKFYLKDAIDQNDLETKKINLPTFILK